MKRPYIICNWKMNPVSKKEADVLAREMSRIANAKQGTLVVAPPALFLERVQNIYKVTAAQDISEFECGAYTGQLSASMMQKAHIPYVIVGHSERRTYQHETDAQIAQKIIRAQEAKIIPIICVGETEKMSISYAWNKIKKQLDILIPSLKKGRAYLFAYEPIWAIGGKKTVDPQYVADIIYRIKLYIRAQIGEIPMVLYGGSVNCENIDSLVYYKNTIDGFIVGSASVQLKEIKNIIKKIYGSC